MASNPKGLHDEPSFQLAAKALHIAADRGEKEVAEVSVVVKKMF